MGKKFGENSCENGNRNANNDNKGKDVENKSTTDYHLHVDNFNHASECEETSQFVTKYVKKPCTRGNDIAEALRTNVKPGTGAWEPELIASSSTGDDAAKQNNRQYERKHKMEHDTCMKRKDILE